MNDNVLVIVYYNKTKQGYECRVLVSNKRSGNVIFDKALKSLTIEELDYIFKVAEECSKKILSKELTKKVKGGKRNGKNKSSKRTKRISR